MEPSHLSAPAGVDRFDWEIVTFMVSWAPYGRPDEEVVLPRFGLTCRQLEERFCVCVSNLTVSRHLRLNRQQRDVLKRAVVLLTRA